MCVIFFALQNLLCVIITKQQNAAVQGGVYLVTLWDTFAAGTSLLFTVLCLCVTVSWVYGKLPDFFLFLFYFDFLVVLLRWLLSLHVEVLFVVDCVCNFVSDLAIVLGNGYSWAVVNKLSELDWEGLGPSRSKGSDDSPPVPSLVTKKVPSEGKGRHSVHSSRFCYLLTYLLDAKYLLQVWISSARTWSRCLVSVPVSTGEFAGRSSVRCSCW